MSKIKITWLNDHYNCETCGSSYSEGAHVEIDGVQFGDFEPIAHCFDSKGFERDEILTAVFAHLGHELVMEDQHSEPETFYDHDEYVEERKGILEALETFPNNIDLRVRLDEIDAILKEMDDK